MFGKPKKTEQQQQKTKKLTRKAAQESRSTKPQSVEKQVNLKALKGEELDTWIKRLAWLYAHGVIDDAVIKNIIEKNKKGEIVNVMMDEILFKEDAELILVFTNDWMSKDPKYYYPDEYVELSSQERKEYGYPVVQFIVDSLEVDVMLEGIAKDDEDGDCAMNFAKAFWTLADEFTGYRQSTGKLAFTMDYKEYLPKNNKMREIRLGYGEEGPEFVMYFDFSKLKNLSKKKRKKFLQAVTELSQAAIDVATGLTRAANGLQGDDNPDEEKDVMTVVDYMLKKSEFWNNSGSREKLQQRIEQLRKAGKKDSEIVKIFKESNYYGGVIKDIETALEKGEDPLAQKPKQKNPNPKPKDPPKTKEGEGKGEPIDPSPYEADAYHRTPVEWATFFCRESDFAKQVAAGFFKDLKVDGTGNVPKISIFEMAAYYQQQETEIPAFVGEEIQSEIKRIEDKRARVTAGA